MHVTSSVLRRMDVLPNTNTSINLIVDLAGYYEVSVPLQSLLPLFCIMCSNLLLESCWDRGHTSRRGDAAN